MPPCFSWVKIKWSTQPFSNAKFLWLQPFCGKCIRAFTIAAMLSFNLWMDTLTFSDKIFWYNPESTIPPRVKTIQILKLQSNLKLYAHTVCFTTGRRASSVEMNGLLQVYHFSVKPKSSPMAHLSTEHGSNCC